MHTYGFDKLILIHMGTTDQSNFIKRFPQHCYSNVKNNQENFQPIVKELNFFLHSVKSLWFFIQNVNYFKIKVLDRCVGVK